MSPYISLPAGTSSAASILIVFLVLAAAETYSASSSVPESDVDLVEFPLNLEFLEAEFFLWGSEGYGLDAAAPNLTMGGPPPVGAKKANLDPFTRDIIYQFALQEIGHLRFFMSPNLSSFLASIAIFLEFYLFIYLFILFQSDSEHGEGIPSAIDESEFIVICRYHEQRIRQAFGAVVRPLRQRPQLSPCVVRHSICGAHRIRRYKP